MANSRIARFFMEVAPPQYVNVMRHRTKKMMETISEEEREISSNDSVISTPKSSSTTSLAACSSSTNATVNTRYFLKEVHRTLSSLNH
ncbi:galactosyltransferase family protein [Trifolium repens]|nr:galactosyltransferase family protein [Trifolium repens]